MKIVGYGFLALILPIIILIILLIILLTILMQPKIRAIRKRARETILQKGEHLSAEEKCELKNKAIKEIEAAIDAEMGTEDLKKARKELMDELKTRDIKDTFK